MVWPFSSSNSSSSPSSSSTSSPSSSNATYTPPLRTSRTQCYASRDELYSCLDRNDILDAGKEDAKSRRVCAGENERFERDCATAWIKYFKDKRVTEYNRDQTIAKIQADDAAMVARQKAEKARKGLSQGGGGGWFGRS